MKEFIKAAIRMKESKYQSKRRNMTERGLIPSLCMFFV